MTDLDKCQYITAENMDDTDYDGCDECQWETWRCHLALAELLRTQLRVEVGRQ